MLELNRILQKFELALTELKTGYRKIIDSATKFILELSNTALVIKYPMMLLNIFFMTWLQSIHLLLNMLCHRDCLAPYQTNGCVLLQ